MKAIISFIICLLVTLAATAQTDSLKTHTLDEVVVTAVQQHTRVDGDGMTTRISGTVLQDLGTAKDVLAYIPEVLNNNGSIEVFGKGTPVFYVNGRPMRNPLELEQLKSSQIKSVKVITNPGARYGSGANAVIRITTVKNVGDGFAMESKTNVGVRDYVYANEQLNLNYRQGGLDIFGILHYDYAKNKGTSLNVQDAKLATHDVTSMYMDSQKHSQTFDGQLGFNHDGFAGHSFGAYYQAIYKPTRDNVTTESSIIQNGVSLGDNTLYRKHSDNFYHHLVDGYYSGTWGRWAAEASFDLLWRNSKDNQSVDQLSDRNIKFNDKSNGRLFAGELNLSKPVWKGSMEFGTAYSNSRRTDEFISSYSLIPDNDNRTSENDVAVYGQLMQRLGRIMLQAGIRYEHIATNYYEFGKKMNDCSRKYNEFLPSLTMVVPVKTATFQLAYSRKYTRPLYSQLSSTVNYVNQYTYETGNPNLKSSYTDNVSLNFRYKWLMVMASYKHTAGRIITSCSDYEGNQGITLLRKVNSPNAINGVEVMASAAPGLIKKFYYPVFMAGIISQFYKMEYRDQSMKFNNPMGIIRFNNIFMLPKNYRLTANFSWRSAGDSENIHLGSTWQIDLSASKTFNSHWDIKLSLNDIFNTARKTQFTLYSGAWNMQTTRRNNTRSIELSVNYRFNVTKSKYKGKGTAQSEKDRF